MPRSEPTTSDVLASYRRWKEDGEALKARAQALLVERFASLVQEAQQLQHDLWEDFGQTVKFPANPKFIRKGKARSNVRKARTSLPEASQSPLRGPVLDKPQVQSTTGVDRSPASAAPGRESSSVSRADRPRTNRTATNRTATNRAHPKPEPDPELLRHREITRLERKRNQAELRLQQAQAEGSAVKIQNAEDRLYEINDELRLLRGTG